MQFTLISKLQLIQFYLFNIFVLNCVTGCDEHYVSYCLTVPVNRRKHEPVTFGVQF